MLLFARKDRNKENRTILIERKRMHNGKIELILKIVKGSPPIQHKLNVFPTNFFDN